MFVREKRIGSYSYLYLVETVRENGKTKQRIIRNLGRKEVVEAGGDLDRLARSAARLSQRSMILSLVVDGSMPNLTCRRIGAPLLFERLWQESGCRAVVEGLLAARRFEFAVERAVFLTVLHRLMVSGSDRACEHWRDDYHIDDIDGLDLHHLYRAMSWLGEELYRLRLIDSWGLRDSAVELKRLGFVVMIRHQGHDHDDDQLAIEQR